MRSDRVVLMSDGDATSSRVERRLAAILAADVAGYSRLMGADEEGTLERLKAHRRERVDPKINERSGSRGTWNRQEPPLPRGSNFDRSLTLWQHGGPTIRTKPILSSPPWQTKHCISGFAKRVFPTNDRRAGNQVGCGCISKPAGRPARRAASAGGRAGSQRLASKRQPLTSSASRDTT